MQRLVFSTLLSVIVIFGSACNKRQPGPETFQGRGLKIGSVVVTVDQDAVSADGLGIFKDMDGVSQIQRLTILELQKFGLYDPASSALLAVKVTGFRLRHGATVFFTGWFSGQDLIRAESTVSKDSQHLLSFEVSEGTFGSLGNLTRDSRGHGLFRAIGIVAAHKLRNEDFPYKK